jgi:hypothetical protein
MRMFMAIGALCLLGACTLSTPAGVFDVRSSANEQVVGHCASDPGATELVAFNARTKELVGATTDNSSLAGFRAISISRPDYRYTLYVPVAFSGEPYHVVCPLGGSANCSVSGTYPGGVFEAYITLKSLARTDAAAQAAFNACKQMTANNSFKPNPLRGSA